MEQWNIIKNLIVFSNKCMLAFGLVFIHSLIIKRRTAHKEVNQDDGGKCSGNLLFNLQAKSKQSPAYLNQDPEVLTNQNHNIPIGILIVKLRSRSQVRCQVRSQVRYQVRYQVGSQVRSKVKSQVRSSRSGSKVKEMDLGYTLNLVCHPPPNFS